MIQKNAQALLVWGGLLFLVFTFSACFKKPSKSATNSEDQSIQKIQKRLAANELNPEWLSAKAKVKYTGSEYKLPFPIKANIRMRKDSAIWVSCTALSVEVGRALLTPDSIKVIMRTEQKYFVSGIDYLQKFVDYPVDFAFLQNMLLGQQFLQSNQLTYKEQNDRHHLYYEDAAITHDLHIDKSSFNIVQMEALEKSAQQKLTMLFDAYAKVDNKPFAMDRTISLEGEESHWANLQFKKVTTGESLSLPFKVSKKYETIRP